MEHEWLYSVVREGDLERKPIYYTYLVKECGFDAMTTGKALYQLELAGIIRGAWEEVDGRWTYCYHL